MFARIGILFASAVLMVAAAPQNSWAGNNLHLIDQNPNNGFAIYRTGEPSRQDIRELCALGVKEIAVLSGNAQDVELRYQSDCPNLKVVYNQVQDPRVALDMNFLKTFDSWVENARANGIKIAFRCTCGCHRTGRLAAYYQMKYQGLHPDQAIDVMNRQGRYMWMFPELKPQVYALADLLVGRPCSVPARYCVRQLPNEYYRYAPTVDRFVTSSTQTLPASRPVVDPVYQP